MVEEEGDSNLIDVRLMNEYSELGLSAELLAELTAFADRWEQNVGTSAFDDRFDSIPIVRELVELWHVLARLSRPAERRADRLENLDMQRTGEALRDRVQAELGRRYRVTYEHS